MTRKPLRMGARRRGDPLPTLGDIRKGMPKGENGLGRELQDFRICNFDDGDSPEAVALQEFIASIGKRVKSSDDRSYYTANHLAFMFPYATVKENLMLFNECYKGGIMIHRCTPDEDRIVVRALDPVTYKPIVIDGHHVETGEIVHCDDKPIYSYHSEKYGVVQVGCSPVVRMKIMLRNQGRVGTWDVLSTSGIDGEHLQHQLETFYIAFTSHPILKDNGLRAIPFILHRMPPQDVPYYDDAGARHTSKHSFISIEIAPDFGALFMESTVRFALAAVEPKALTAPALTSDGPKWDEETNGDDILDQASGGVVDQIITPDAPAPEQVAQQALSQVKAGTEAQPVDWQMKFNALCIDKNLSKPIRDALLQDAGGDLQTAYEKGIKRYGNGVGKAK